MIVSECTVNGNAGDGTAQGTCPYDYQTCSADGSCSTYYYRYYCYTYAHLSLFLLLYIYIYIYMLISILIDCNDDNLQNNGESGVDCGGGGCPTCGRFGVCVSS